MTRAPAGRRRKLVVVASIFVVITAAVGVLAYSLGAFRPNVAQSAFGPIANALESAGAQRICDNGDAGYGPDNTAPWYDTTYLMPSTPQLTNRLIAIGANQGFSLTRRDTTGDPTGVHLLQAHGRDGALTVSLPSGPTARDCHSSTVSKQPGMTVVGFQLIFPSHTDGVTIPLEPEATQTPGTPQLPWVERRFGTFTPFVIDGTGPKVITLPPDVTTGALTVSHTGSGPFSIVALDQAGASTGELIIDMAGDYSGIVPFGLQGVGTVAKSLTVTSDGTWSLSFAPLTSVPTITLPSAGTGDRIFRYSGPAGDWKFTNSTPNMNTFEVRQYFADLAVDSAYSGDGIFSGPGPVNAGPSVIVISSRGKWTLAQQ
jgi:hypothetical protein